MRWTTIWWLGLAMLGNVVVASAQRSVTVTQSTRVKDGQRRFTYSVTFKGVTKQQTLECSIDLHPDATVAVGDGVTSTRRGSRYTFKKRTDGDFEFKISAQISASTPIGPVDWSASFDGENTGGKVLGPLSGPSTFRLGIAIGADFRQDDFVDFAEPATDDTVLRVVNDSRMRTAVNFGALFKIAEIKGRPLDLMASFQFTEGTVNDVDGFTFGLAYKVAGPVSFVGGVSLVRGHELSNSFRRAVAQHIAGSGDETLMDRFPLNPAGDDLADEKLWDGVPLKTPAGQAIFSGNPIADSTNLSYFVGFVFPLDILQWVGNASK